MERPSVMVRSILEVALKKCNGNVSELARKIGMSNLTISHWYRSGAWPSEAKLKQVEDFVYGGENDLIQSTKK